MFSFLRGRKKSRCSSRTSLFGKCSCKKLGDKKLSLEPLEERQMLSITWSGLGGDNLWSNSANWVGSQVPGAGEDLIFSGNSQTNMQNDLAYAFESLTFASDDFSISGNTVLLDGDMVLNSGVDDISISAGVSFSDTANIDLGYGANMTVSGTISNANSLSILVASGSSMTASGDITGDGTLSFDLGYGSSITAAGIDGSDSIAMNILAGSSVTIQDGLSDIGDLTVLEDDGANLMISDGISGDGDITFTKDAGAVLGIDGGIISTGTLTISDGIGAVSFIGDSVSGLSAINCNIATGAVTTFGGNIYGATDLTKAGTGTLTLSGHNAFTGTTTISEGTIKLENSDSLGGSTLDYSIGSGTLDIGTLTELTFGGLSGDRDFALTNASQPLSLTVGGNNSDTTYSGVLSGSGSLTKTGTGTLTLSGSTGNTYTGNTVIQGGELHLDKSSGVAIAGDIYFEGDNNNIIQLYRDEQIVDTATLYFNNTGNYGRLYLRCHTETVAGINTLNDRGVIQNTQTDSGFDSEGKLIVAGSADSYFAGFLRDDYSSSSSGTVSLEKQGAGTLTLVGDHIYHTGEATITDGTLVLEDVNNSIFEDTSIVNNAALVFNNTTVDSTHSGTISGTGSLTKNGSEGLTLDGNNTYSGTTTINAGTLQIGDGGTTGTLGTGDVTVGSDSDLEFYRTDLSTWLYIDNNISGTGDLLFRSSGEASRGSYQLTGDNSGFSGTITVDDGRLKVTEPDNLGSSSTPVSIASGGQLYVSSTDTFYQPLTLAGTGWSESAGTLGALRLRGGATWAGDIDLTAATRITAYNSTGTIVGDIDGDYILALRYNGTLNLDPSAGNDYAHLKIGTGMTVVAGNENAIADGTVVTMQGGTLQLNGHDFTISNLSGEGHIENSHASISAILTVDMSSDRTYSGTLADGGVATLGLTKNGTENLTLSGSIGNTYTGDTTIIGGELWLEKSNGVAVPGDIYFEGTSRTHLQINADEQIVDSASLYFNNTADYGRVCLRGHTETVAGINTLYGRGVIQNIHSESGIDSDGTLIVDNSEDCYFAGYLRDKYSGDSAGITHLVKRGDGTLTLSGTKIRYTGTTSIDDGTLQIGDGGTSGTLSTGNVTIDSGSNLVFYRTDHYQDTIEIPNTLSGSGTITIMSDNGQEVGSYRLMADNSNFTGTLNVSGARLADNDAASFGNPSMIYVDNGGQIFASQDTFTQPLTISGDGFTEEAGVLGALRLLRATWSGDITLADDARIATYGSTGTISGDIDGTGQLSTEYKGTLTLTGTNTYTGGTVINTTTVNIGDGGTTGSILGDVVNNGTLAFNRSDNITFSNVISGTGNLIKNNTNTLTLTADNAYEGMTIINDGTLYVGDGSTNGSLGTGTVVNNGSLTFNTADDHRAFVAGTGSLTLAGTGDFILDYPGTPSVAINDPNGHLIPGGVSSVTAQTVMPNMPMTLTATVADPWNECQSVAFYQDINNNGVIDAGDTLLGNGTNSDGYWSVTVDTNGWGPTTDNVIAQATFPTNSEHPPATTENSTPLKVRADWAILSSADQTGYEEFGSGFTTVWSDEAVGGQYREMSGTDENAYVTYTFTDLAPGNYEIWEHHNVGSQYSTSVPIEVYDGDVATGTLQQTFNLNETELGWSNWETDGYDWNWSDEVIYSNSGTITVVVACNGLLTQAPAIRLISAPESGSANCPSTSSDPISYAKGEIKSCGCGDEVQGTFYSNLKITDTPGDTGYGMFDDRPTLEGKGMYVTFIDENGCEVLVWIEPVRTYTPQYGNKATLIDKGTYLELTLTSGTIHHFGYPDTTGPFSTGPWMGTIEPGGESDKVVLWANDQGQTSATYGNGYTKMAQVDYKASSTAHAHASELIDYYDSGENAGLRESIIYRTWDVEANGGLGGWVNDRMVKYTYYGSSDSNGSLHDLKTATTCYPDSSTVSGWSDGDTIYHRYYTGATYEGSEQIGFAHGLKRKLLPEAYAKAEKFATDNSTTVDALTDAQIAPFTCFYYKYDENQRVTFEEVYGELRTTTYEYTEGTNVKNANLWTRKTVENRPDGATYTVYTNFLGETIFSDLEDVSGNHWYTYREYDANGNVTLDAQSSAIASYAEDTSTTGQLNITGTAKPNDDPGTAGLVHTYTYGTSDTAGETTAGDVIGYLKSTGVANGLNGTTVVTAEYTYYTHTATGQTGSQQTVYHLAEHTKYTETDTTGAITSEYDAPTWYTNSVQINEKTLDLPVISSSQNGSGTADSTQKWYDANGNLTWTLDQAGRATYYHYDSLTGQVDYSIQDVDLGQGLTQPTGWASLPTDGLHLRTDYQYDDDGRLVQTLGPKHTDDEGTSVRTASWTVYDDTGHQTFSVQGYATETTSGVWTTYTIVNPVSITVTNNDGDITERIQAALVNNSGSFVWSTNPATATTELSLGTTSPLTLLQTLGAPASQSSYTAWTTYQYANKQLVGTRTYHTIPASGDGSSFTNYDETLYGYDAIGRSEWIQTPDGTINWNFRDARGLVVATWVGTDLDYNNDEVMDTTYFRTWLGNNPTATTGPAGTSMVLVSANIYDNGNDEGDGLLTESRAYFGSDSTDYYATKYQYDWRNRVTDILSPGDIVTHYQYDNLGRTLETKTYASDDFTLFTGELRAWTKNLYDDLGRVYETHTYEVADDGTEGDYLPNYTWYDSRGQVIKNSNANGLFQKYAYDGLGRQVTSYTCYDTNETYSDADDVTGDTVIQQNQTWYSQAGNVVASATYQRLPDDTSTSGALSAANSYASAQVLWYDGLGRSVATANYGREDVDSGLTHYIFHGTSGTDTGGAYAAGDLVDVSRDGLPDVAQDDPPATNSSDNYIVSLAQYNSAGQVYRTTDNLGRINETQYDDVGRTIKTIQNYDNGTVEETDLDQDITVAYDYSAGRLITLTAYNAKGDDSNASNENVEEQATKYLYDSTINATWQTAEIYPDSTDTLSQDVNTRVWSFGTGDSDHTSTTYDRMGRTATTTDQRGVVHTYTYDTDGRLSADTATSLGTSGIVDDSIRRIGTTYDDVGRVETITSYSDTSGTTAVNQVKYEYNAWGQISREYQEHDGTVDANTLYIDYTYTDGASNDVAKYVRLDQITYPNRRDVNYDYGTTGATDDIMSRLVSIKDNDDSTVLASYKYLGAGTTVEENYEDIDVKLDYAHDDLSGFDRFGRIADQLWKDYGATPDTALDQYKYDYDRAGNRIWKENVVSGNLSTPVHLDELYTYDDSDRLSGTERGNLVDGQNGKEISGTPGFTQDWTLDGLGNWSEFDDDGTSQTRTANAANEITSITGGSVVPTYDTAGNMTSGPSPDNPTVRLHYKYDAWNRLVKVQADNSGNPGTLIAEYEYDGKKQRIVKGVDDDADGSLDTFTHFLHSGNQVIETREGDDISGAAPAADSLTPKYQNIWSPRYIDSLILRDEHNAQGQVVTANRLYYLADANYNVTALVDASGDVVERYLYTPYGKVTVLDADFSADADGKSDHSNTTLYTGRELDPETGLMYYRARYYDANLGRFASRDPIGYVDSSWNLYEYAGGQVLTLVDPTGNIPCRWGLRQRSCSEVRWFVGANYPLIDLNGPLPVGQTFDELLHRLKVHASGQAEKAFYEITLPEPILPDCECLYDNIDIEDDTYIGTETVERTIWWGVVPRGPGVVLRIREKPRRGYLGPVYVKITVDLYIKKAIKTGTCWEEVLI